MTISNLLYDTDYLFNINSLAKTNEIVEAVNAVSPLEFYVVEGVFQDTTTQSGSPVDVPKTVLYGTNKDSDNGHISYLNGILTVNTTGWYAFKSRIRASRSGAAGSSALFFWAEVSTDGGSNWDVSGASIDVRLDNAQSNKIFFDFSTLFLPAGTKLRSRFARSSTGNDSGNLVPSTPSVALQGFGVQVAPSAQLTIYKAQ